MTACRAADCERPTSAFLCRACSEELDDAFGDLPGLVDDLLTAATRQARVYRATSHKRQPDKDWRGSPDAIGQSPMPLDLDATAMLNAARNTLTTWARHVAGSRGVTLTAIEPSGPVCAGHEHDFTPEGCGHHPEQCKQLHPGHVHSMKPRGCGLDLDPDTGMPRCQLHHCAHLSCALIRRGQLTGVAAQLVRWFLNHADTIRLDEAAGEIHADIVGLRDDLLRAVDRSPSPFYAGPCHAQTTEPTTTTRDGTIYVQTVTRRCERQLYAWPGAKEIRCDGYRSADPGDEGCGAVHTFAERDAWLRDAVEDALLTIDEMASVLPRMFKAYPQPPRSVMHAWVRQGRLVAHGVNHSGEPTFTGADMLELIARYRPKTFAPRPGRKTARMAS